MLSACSAPRVKIANDLMPEHIRSLAMLPTDYPADVQREKVDAIVKSVKSELTNSNYVVLADKLVSENCAEPTCPSGRKKLADKYQVDGFISVAVSSVSRTNFIAGFYNAIRGKLILSDVKSNPVVEVEHTTSEKGGLLFNTGQIIQALISYGNNTEADSFSKLSTRFAQSLVTSIPRSKDSSVNNDAVAVSISDVKIKQVKPEIFQVCAEATADSVVSVVVNKQSTNLRAVTPQNYCGTFLFNQASSENGAKVYVDARSPFGNSVRKEIELANQVEVCNLNDNVLLSQQNGKPVIQIACVDVGGKTQVFASCENKISVCPGNKFIVFRSNSDLGPFEKVAEIKSTSWVDNSAKKGSETYYELVSVNKSGVWSLPVAAKSVVKEG